MSQLPTFGSQNKQFDLAPQTFEQLMSFAELVANSGMVPKDYIGKPGNVVVAVQMGVEIGLKPLGFSPFWAF